MTKGMIFDIQRFCLDDGPGIRTTVFLKGCPLRCKWCHNAEGLSTKAQLYYLAEHCTVCASCVSICPTGAQSCDENGHKTDFSKCIACGACEKVCKSGALRIAGEEKSAEEVIAEVLKDKPFYVNSGGGMTLSGGEPLLQGEFALSLATLAKKNELNVAVETSGYCSRDVLARLAPFVDLFLFDFKHFDTKKHQQYTGVENGSILENLAFLSAIGKEIILRCPIIPGCNDSEEHYGAIASLADSLDGIKEVHIEPYHPFGIGKYAAIGAEAVYQSDKPMSLEKAEAIAERIRTACSKKVIVS